MLYRLNYHLVTDGVDDYAVPPLMEFDEIVFVMKDVFDDFVKIEPNGFMWIDGNKLMTIDSATWTISINGGSRVDIPTWDQSQSNPLIVDTEVKQSYSIKRVNSLVVNTQVFFFMANADNYHGRGKFYDIKFLLNGVVQAHYDLTLGNFEDQSGNNRHVTLYGGEWVVDENTTPPAVEEVEYSFHVKQVITKQTTDNFHVKQVITKQTTDNFHVKQTIFKAISDNFHVKQLIFKEHTHEAHTRQTIIKQVQIDFPTSQLISIASELIFPTKQVMYKETTDTFHLTQLINNEKIYEAHTKQIITQQIQANFPTKQLVFKTAEITFPINQVISKRLEVTFPTKQVVIRDEEVFGELEFILFRNSETLFPTRVNIFKTDDLSNYTQTVEFTTALIKEAEFKITITKEIEFTVVLTKEVSFTLKI